MDAVESLLTGELYRTALIAGLGVVVMCGVLSVLVVVKRLGFVGQGVSHSAFGGVGVASVLAVMLPAGVLSAGNLEAAQFGVIVLFCIAAALGMAAVSNRRTVPADTAIGMFLVGSMALGAVLVDTARRMAVSGGRGSMVQSWESILFGSIYFANERDAVVAWCIAAGVVGTAWWFRRPMVFWVFDEETAPAFGVSGGRMKVALMVLLAVAIVVAMKLAGVVLATALLVLPGATALRLTSRLWASVGAAVLCGVVGLVVGLWASIQFDWQPGPCVVLALTGLFAAASVGGRTIQSKGTA